MSGLKAVTSAFRWSKAFDLAMLVGFSRSMFGCNVISANGTLTDGFEVVVGIFCSCLVLIGCLRTRNGPTVGQITASCRRPTTTGIVLNSPSPEGRYFEVWSSCVQGTVFTERR